MDINTLRKELEATGLPWEIKRGKRHQKIFLNGRLVGVMPHVGKNSSNDQHSYKNVRAQIRRAAASAKEQKGRKK